MELTEHTISSETIFEGKIITVQRDMARLPDGKSASREVVRHPGGVTVLPLGADGTVTLVRQYRYPLGQELLELPAGKLERNGEDHRSAAIRELGEETGADSEPDHELLWLPVEKCVREMFLQYQAWAITLAWEEERKKNNDGL